MIPPAAVEAKRPPPDSWLVVALRGLALGVAAFALLVEVALPAGLVGAVGGTLAAVAAASSLARSRVRLLAVWLAAALAGAVAPLVGAWLVDGAAGSALLGIRGAMSAGDAIRFGLLAFALTLALRTSSTRYEVVEVVELVIVALSLAGVMAAHRAGALNHPRWLSDWAWTNGHDPQRILLWLGAGTLVALVLALMRERRGRGARVLLHFAAAALLAALAAVFVVTVFGAPRPRRGEGLGLDGGRPEEGQGRPSAGGTGQAGNQLNQLEFKDDYSSKSQDSPVAVVILHDDYSPPLGYYYFRQTAFSQYNGHRLVATTRDDLDRDILTDFPTGKTAIPEAPAAGAGRERVPIHSTVALLVDHVRPFGLESPAEITPKPSPDLSRFQRVYDVTSSALAMPYEDLLGKHSSRWKASPAQEAYTRLPDDPRYKQLADKIIDETLRPEWRDDPFAQAIAISSWLGKNSVYSMKSQHAGADDPTADFLFGDRTGYCVHFAHAAAFLLRARGLPARIASGYVADEGRRGTGSTIMLRQKDAHAWAELALDGFGWIIVDVAPERSLDPPDTPPDQDLQRILGELARGDPRAGKMPPPGASHAWPTLAQVLRRAAVGLLALLACCWLVKLWRIGAPSVAGPRSVHRVAYRAALDRLAEVGMARARGETRERFAVRAAPFAPSLSPLTEAHLARAFGSRRLAPVGETRRLARGAWSEAWAHAPWWRILIGFANPLSWLRSR